MEIVKDREIYRGMFVDVHKIRQSGLVVVSQQTREKI